MKPKTFLQGAWLVWHRQRVVWLIYVVTLLLAFLSTRGVAGRTADVLNHSAESVRLVHGFDVGALIELGEIPDSPLAGQSAMFAAPAILMLIFLIFVAGGALATYYRDESLPFGQFFEACGEHFWRFLRLVIYFAIAMIPVGILIGIASAVEHHIDETAVSPLSAFRFSVAAGIVILLIAMAIRLWFDMAQVIAVAEEERAMHRALRHAARLLWNNFISLYWTYLRISIVAMAGFGAALYLWMIVLKPEATRLAFFLGQLMILWWISTRLWQRASQAKWYWEYRGSEVPVKPTWSAPSPVEDAAAPVTPA